MGLHKMNQLDFIMIVELEGFDSSNPDHVEALQNMINNGMAWKLQGFWGRLAAFAIEEGICHE
jgi:hypothetical protein